MKKKIIALMGVAMLLMLAVTLQSAKPDDVITKEDGMTVVNTTTLGKSVIGYVDITPLKIYINEDGRAKMEIAIGRGKKLYDKRGRLPSISRR